VNHSTFENRPRIRVIRVIRSPPYHTTQPNPARHKRNCRTHKSSHPLLPGRQGITAPPAALAFIAFCAVHSASSKTWERRKDQNIAGALPSLPGGKNTPQDLHLFNAWISRFDFFDA